MWKGTLLIQSLNTLISLSPGGKYNNAFLYRLSELYYEKAVINFENSLHEYEKDYTRFEKGEIKEEPVYPSYDFTQVMSLYKQILKNYPDPDLASEVLYFTGICHQKSDDAVKANSAFEVLVKAYPKSSYYLDALMEIGGYYFNNPLSFNGNGYTHAIDIYKEVLKHRDSDKFIEALYRLAWCYYMIDKYQDAVTVFRHLIEEIDITETYGSEKGKESKNPMFREEAIEYIAVSLCEVGDLKRVSMFLEMIGNKEYSLMILNRMGEYYEEQLDYDQAMLCYDMMMKDYPSFGHVLDGRMGNIRCLERKEDLVKAQAMKEEFFKLYSRGGDWQKKIKNTSYLAKADSLSIKCILSAAQYRITEARKTGNAGDYDAVVRYYIMLGKEYPETPESYEAIWSSAVILEQNLNKSDTARIIYLDISQRKEEKHKLQAAINAIAVAQRFPETETPDTGRLTERDKKVVEACQNYVKLFPDRGAETIDVAFIPASLYFNRKIYSKALSIYQLIIAKAKTPSNPKALEAALYAGQCYVGMKDYVNAEKTFGELFAAAPEGKYREDAKVRQVEAAFQNAEEKRSSKEYKAAGELFLRIEEKYPFFVNLDIVLFNAADAFEKQKDWSGAAAIYRRIPAKFPGSKLADGAFFNGAICFENDSNYIEAILNYESLLSKYPTSERAKDALYNIGLCYEKMKVYDKMAEAQERYAEKYPDSKEVEAMLFTSAKFFNESGKLDRARKAYESFIRRYPGSAGEIECRFNLGQIMFKEGDKKGAEDAFSQLIERNTVLAAIGKNNDYYSGEAAFRLADMVREKYMAVRFKLPVKAMEDAQREKADLLKKTVEAYSRVIKLKSERLFEAAFRIGEAYTHFADVYYQQERDTKLENTKQIIFERDLNLASLDLYEKSVEPHLVNINIAGTINLDSLKKEQTRYIELSKQALGQVFVSQGSYVEKATEVLLSSPVPEKIKRQPVQYYLYQQKLVETVFPMLDQAIDKYSSNAKRIKEKGLPDSLITAVNDSLSRILFRRGDLLEKLSSEMLNNPQIPKEMKESEREELAFQLEDIAFEIQDHALKIFEEGYNYLNDQNINNKWKQKILEALKKLDPQTYTPKDVLKTIRIGTDDSWMARTDSLPLWNKLSRIDTAWTRTTVKPVPQDTSARFKDFAAIGHAKGQGLVYLKKQFLIPGKVTAASLAIKSTGPYKFFINGVPIAGDTSKSRISERIDSVDLKTLISGGDNALCAVVNCSDNSSGFLLSLSAIIDTSLHFESAFNLPILSDKKTDPIISPPPVPVLASVPTQPLIPSVPSAPVKAPEKIQAPSQDSTKAKTLVAKIDTSKAGTAQVVVAPAPVKNEVPSEPAKKPITLVETKKSEPPQKNEKKAEEKQKPFYEEFKNYGEFEKAIQTAETREAEANTEIKSMQTRIRGIKYRIRAVDDNIKATENDIKVYRKILENKERKR